MGTGITVFVLLLAFSCRVIGFQEDVISNVNFGTFLTPQGEVVNSGSTWVHTFEIDELLGDPIPAGIRAPWRPSMMECGQISENAFAGIRRRHQNISMGDVQNLAENICNDVMTIEKTFNEHKDILIAEVDHNVKSLEKFVREDSDFRNGSNNFLTRVRRAPVEFISKAAEKLFGIGRKKSIDLAHSNHDMLRQQVNASLGKLLANQKTLRSVVMLQDRALTKTAKTLSRDHRKLEEITNEIRKTRNHMQFLEEVESSQFVYIYNLIGHQSGLHTQLTKATLSMLGSLRLMKDRTGILLSAFQKLSSGYLPIELVPVSKVEDALEQIDNLLMKPRLQFHLAIRSVKYYYGMQTASFVVNGKLNIVMKVPLTTVGAIFSVYSVNTIKLPFSSTRGDGSDHRYTKIAGHSEFFGISEDKEHYVELDEKQMLNCRGIPGFPRICNPVMLMNSVKDKPGCSLSLFTGNATMMAGHCVKHYYEQPEPDEQIYQIGKGEILVTAEEGQFIKHCADGSQMQTIDACKLCIMKLPCGCFLKTRRALMPPLLDGCNRGSTTSKIRYPANVALLSQLLNTSLLQEYSGSKTYQNAVRIDIPNYTVRKFEHETIAEMDEDIMSLERVMTLAKISEDIYLDDSSYLATPHTLAQKMWATKFSGFVQIGLAGMQILAVVLGYIAYKKGCISVATSAAAMQSVTSWKKSYAEELTSGDDHDTMLWGMSPIEERETGMRHIPPPVSAAVGRTSGHIEYWEIIRPLVYLYVTYLVARLVYSFLKGMYQYLAIRLVVNPMGTIPAKSEFSHVYLSVGNGEKSLKIYVYTIQMSDHRVTLIQEQDKEVQVEAIPKWPKTLLSYAVKITNEVVLLKTQSGQRMKLPRHIYVPVLVIRRLHAIISGPYTTELYIGNGLYRTLVPEYVEVTEDNDLSITVDSASEKSDRTVDEPTIIPVEAKTNICPYCSKRGEEHLKTDQCKKDGSTVETTL